MSAIINGGGPLAVVARTGIVAGDGAPINLTTSIPLSGTYRISWYVVVTSAFTTTGPSIAFRWTDISGTAQVISATASTSVGSLIPAGATINFTQIIQSSGTANITYQITSTGTFGACAAYVVLERLA